MDYKAGADEQTALHHEVKNGAEHALAMLLSHGASPQCKDKAGCDALALAMENAAGLPAEDHIEIMLQLRDVMKKIWPKEVDKCVLELACDARDTTLMQDLLKGGLDPKTKWHNRPLFLRAIGYGNQAAVESLTEWGAVVDVQDMDAVRYAVRREEFEIAKFLVKKGKYDRESNRLTIQELEKQFEEKEKEQK